ncbi:hypothetical protein GHT06_001901 [Daphnia sinensis]|uniref:Uncharacterized protein n=1 Tax=Daphnia sinensis TaxID=1820382 RepID=A0AAD5KDH0_9CRUS|nr:hypothetical protein GHT06_001901 [Daphnia sinensis]
MSTRYPAKMITTTSESTVALSEFFRDPTFMSASDGFLPFVDSLDDKTVQNMIDWTLKFRQPGYIDQTKVFTAATAKIGLVTYNASGAIDANYVNATTAAADALLISVDTATKTIAPVTGTLGWSPQRLYNALKNWWATFASDTDFLVATGNGYLDLGDYNTSSDFRFIAGIASDALKDVRTTGLINSLTNDIPITDSRGTSTRLILTNLTNTTVLILSSSGTQYQLSTGLTGTFAGYIEPGSTERYGYKRITGTLVPSLGGTTTVTLDWLTDGAITVNNAATVSAYTDLSTLDKELRVLGHGLLNYMDFRGKLVLSRLLREDQSILTLLGLETHLYCSDTINCHAYTSLNNLDELYDYSCYVRTQEPLYVVLTAAAGKIFTDADIVLDGTTSTLWDYDPVSETLTIGTSLLASGSILTGIETSGTITLTNGAVLTSLFTDSSGGNYSALIAYTPDANITQSSVSAVEAYTEITTLNELYDYAAYMRTQEPRYVLASRNGVSVDFGSVNIIIDATASAVWSYNQPTNTLTIKSTNLASLTRFTTLLTTGTITLANGATITSLYTSAAGPSARLTYSNLTDASIYTTTGTGVQYDLQTGVTGTLVNYFAPGLTGTYRWYTEQYGFQRQNGLFSPVLGGDFFASPTGFQTLT